MQPIQKFSDFQTKKAESTQAIKEADLQKEYGEVFMSLLKKYGVSSPAELDDEKKKEFFNEIGDFYKKGEGQTAKGEELVDKEGGEAPVKEDDAEGKAEEWKDDEEEIDNIASNENVEDEDDAEKKDHYEGAAKDDEDHIEKLEKDKEHDKEEEKEIDEDAAEEIEKEIVAMGEPDSAKGEVEKQPEEVEAAAEIEEDPEAGKAAEIAPDEDTAKDIEKEIQAMGEPQKVVMDFDSFVKAKM
jgi:hypothetical protein